MPKAWLSSLCFYFVFISFYFAESTLNAIWIDWDTFSVSIPSFSSTATCSTIYGGSSGTYCSIIYGGSLGAYFSIIYGGSSGAYYSIIYGGSSIIFFYSLS